MTSKGWTYYPPKYKAWKKAMAQLLPDLLQGTGQPLPYENPVVVWSTFRVTRPKTTKLQHPRGDIDNYEKSLWDSLTDAGVWLDDCQVVASHSEKHWADPGVEGHIEVAIKCLI